MTARRPSSSCSSPTSSRASTTFSSSPASMRRTASATAASYRSGGTAPGENVTRGTRRFGAGSGISRVSDAAASAASAAAAASAGSASSSTVASVMRVTHARPSRRPSTSSGTMSTLVDAESSANANAPNATRPVPGRPTRSSMSRGGRDRRPRGGGVGDAVGSAGLDAQRLAEADDALAASHPEQRMPRVGARDQRRELIDGFGADDEPRGGDARRRGIRLGHRTQPTRRRRACRRPAGSGGTTSTPCQKATWSAISAACSEGVGVVPGRVRVAACRRPRRGSSSRCPSRGTRCGCRSERSTARSSDSRGK